MAVIKHPSKEGWYILDIRNGKKGPRQRIPFCGTWEAAFDEYNRLRGQKLGYSDNTTPIGDLVPEFLREYALEKSPGTIKDWKYSWKRLAPFFSQIPFHSLNAQLIVAYKESRLKDSWSPAHNSKDQAVRDLHSKPISKRNINKELSYFSALCKWAHEKGYCPDLGFRIKGFRKKDARPRAPVVLHDGEMEKVLSQMREPQRTMATAMHDAGLRRTECCTLRREQVDLERGMITVIGKGNKERHVPIVSERLQTALEKACDGKEKGYLFINPRTGKPYQNVCDAIKNAAWRAGVSKRIYHHLLRHCFGTEMARSNVHPTAMKDALGHETFEVTNMYVHNAAEFLRSELSKMHPKKGGQKSTPQETGNIE